MTDAAQWLIDTAKRNPEGILVVAAGCALLMRSRGAFSSSGKDSVSGSSRDASTLSRASESATQMAGSIGTRIAEAGSQVTGQAGEMAKTLSAQTSEVAAKAQSLVGSGFGQLVREQPLAFIALGLAAGAAVAALLPATAIEERTLGGARDAISAMSGNLVAAATDAGQRLKEGITERASEGLKELAQEVGGQFTEKVMGHDGDAGDAAGTSTPPRRTS
jgi:hypothetical protein